MGLHLSRASGSQVVNELRLDQDRNPNHFSVELEAYEQECHVDPDVRNFDEGLHERTGRALSALASGLETDGMSLSTLQQITTILLEVDRDVVNLILEYKQDIGKNSDLFELVELYFANNLQTLDFCAQLEYSLAKAKNNQLIIQIALHQLPEHGEPNELQIKKILEEFGNFKKAKSPFSDELWNEFKVVYRKHQEMLDKLQAKKRKLDKKKHMNAWRKLSTIMFGAAFAAVVICSVVLAAISAPADIAGAVSASISLFTVGKWSINGLKKVEDEIQRQLDAGRTLHIGPFVTLTELDTIQRLLDRLSETMEAIISNIDFTVGDQDAIRSGIEEIKLKHEAFMKQIDDLDAYMMSCIESTRKARVVVLQKIIRLD